LGTTTRKRLSPAACRGVATKRFDAQTRRRIVKSSIAQM
jgi:hypothetical protein